MNFRDLEKIILSPRKVLEIKKKKKRYEPRDVDSMWSLKQLLDYHTTHRDNTGKQKITKRPVLFIAIKFTGILLLFELLSLKGFTELLSIAFASDIVLFHVLLIVSVIQCCSHSII